MNNEHLCPECGSSIIAGEQFCADCGASLPKFPNKSVNTDTDESIIGAGASVNVMEGIHKTSNTHINTSKVDNSSTVNNNTTIVMNAEKTEYCEVCGDPLGEKHARCPKCGKYICFDCKVKGKNRCVECEKKYIDEYRIAFQQLLLATAGNIGVAGKQMMNQKARELNIEEVKDKVEMEVISLFLPDKVVSQPRVASHTPASKRYQFTAQDNRMSQPVAKSMVTSETSSVKSGGKKVGKMGLIVTAVLLVIVAGVFLLMPSGKDEPASSSLPVTEQQKVVEEKLAVVEKKAEAPQKKAQPVAQPVRTQPAQTKPATQVESPALVVKKVDANYEAGIAAYKSGNGLEAVKAFTKSASAEAYYMLGMIYKNGCGSVAKNEMMARKHFKKAASMGHKEAKSQL